MLEFIYLPVLTFVQVREPPWLRSWGRGCTSGRSGNSGKFFFFLGGGEQKGKHCVLFKNWFWEVFIMILTKITKKVVSKNINKLSFVKYRYLVLVTFCYKKKI